MSKKSPPSLGFGTDTITDHQDDLIVAIARRTTGDPDNMFDRSVPASVVKSFGQQLRDSISSSRNYMQIFAELATFLSWYEVERVLGIDQQVEEGLAKIPRKAAAAVAATYVLPEKTARKQISQLSEKKSINYVIYTFMKPTGSSYVVKTNEGHWQFMAHPFIVEGNDPVEILKQSLVEDFGKRPEKMGFGQSAESLPENVTSFRFSAKAIDKKHGDRVVYHAFIIYVPDTATAVPVDEDEYPDYSWSPYIFTESTAETGKTMITERKKTVEIKLIPASKKLVTDYLNPTKAKTGPALLPPPPPPPPAKSRQNLSVGRGRGRGTGRGRGSAGWR